MLSPCLPEFVFFCLECETHAAHAFSTPTAVVVCYRLSYGITNQKGIDKYFSTPPKGLGASPTGRNNYCRRFATLLPAPQHPRFLENCCRRHSAPRLSSADTPRGCSEGAVLPSPQPQYLQAIRTDFVLSLKACYCYRLRPARVPATLSKRPRPVHRFRRCHRGPWSPS